MPGPSGCEKGVFELIDIDRLLSRGLIEHWLEEVLVLGVKIVEEFAQLARDKRVSLERLSHPAERLVTRLNAKHLVRLSIFVHRQIYWVHFANSAGKPDFGQVLLNFDNEFFVQEFLLRQLLS